MRIVALPQVIVLAVALGCAVPAARAQTTPPPNQPPQGQGAGEAGATVAIPRFSIQRVDGGYLRLDAENGSVAFCAPRNPSWNCQSVSDNRSGAEKEVVCTPRGDPDWSCQSLNVDRAELVKEIARMQEQVTSLKQTFDRQKDEVASLKKEAAQRQEEITSLKQEVGHRQQDVVSLKEKFDRQQDAVTSLKQDVARRQEEVASLKAAFDRRQDEMASLKQEVAHRQDEVTSLKSEVARRQEEIMSLKKEADRRQEEATLLKQEMAALRAPPPPSADRTGDLTIKLPSRDDIARAGTYLQDTAKDAWQRLVDMISHFQKDVMRKS